ncbi:hypothetical protein [Bosea thiooxidans]
MKAFAEAHPGETAAQQPCRRAFVATYALALAADAAMSTDRNAIREALTTLKITDGPAAVLPAPVLSFDEQCSRRRPASSSRRSKASLSLSGRKPSPPARRHPSRADRPIRHDPPRRAARQRRGARGAACRRPSFSRPCSAGSPTGRSTRSSRWG